MLADLGLELARAVKKGGVGLLGKALRLIEDENDPQKDQILTRIALGYGFSGRWKDEGIQIIEKLDPSLELAEALVEISLHFVETTEPDQAGRSLLFLRQVLKDLPADERDKILPRAAVVHLRAGKENLGSELLEAIEERETKYEAEVLISEQLLEEGKTEESSKRAEKVREKIEKLKGPTREVLLERIGNLQAMAGEARIANKTAKALLDPSATARVQLKVSEYFRLARDEKKAASWLSKSNKTLREAPRNSARILTKGFLALQASRLGKNYKSTRTLESAKKEAAELENTHERAFALARIGEIHFEAGQKKEGESLLKGAYKSVFKMKEEDSRLKFYFGPVKKGEKNLEDHFLKFLSRAKETVDAAFFEIRSDVVTDAFIQAKKDGIKVRIVVDSMNYYGKNHETGEISKRTRNPFVKRLLEAKVDVAQDEGRSSLMHNKFCVIDSSWVWTGSYNLTDTGAERNENSAMEVLNPRMASIYTREFKEMFEDAQYGTTSPSHRDDQEVRIEGKRFEVFFAPEDDPLQEIRNYVKDAKQGVYFMQFALTDDKLGELLVERHKQDIEVKGMFDYLLYRSTGPYAEFSYLASQDVPVVVFRSPLNGKLHHKVFIIDPEGEEPKVIFGSENSSASGNNSNDENIVIVHDAQIAKVYYQKFKELYGRTSSVQAEFLRDDPLGKKVKRIRLEIDSKGTEVEQIRIEFPARWPKPEKDVTTFKIFREQNGRLVNTKEDDDVIRRPKALLIKNADLSKRGEGSRLYVDFINFALPKIPGFYNLYVEVKYPKSAFLPLTNQPAIEVVKGKPEDGEETKK